MGTADGRVVLPAVALREPLPPTEQFNIVLVAEGYTAAQQADFDDRCTEFLEVLEAEPWFSVGGSGINVYRLNVESNESGADDPVACEGPGTTAATYFDATYCNSDIRRCLLGDDDLVTAELDAAVPQWNVAVVVVNATEHGGCRRNLSRICWTSTGSGWQGTIMHELGHAAWNLADEYDYFSDCASQDVRTHAEEANVTRSTTRGTLKWRHLLAPGIAVPTMSSIDCANCDARPNVIGDDQAIGLFEGARYEHCSMFRPAYTCKMRESAQPFCRVCVETIVTALAPFSLVTSTLEVTPTTRDFGSVAAGLTAFLSFQVRNVRGSGHPVPMAVTLTAPTGGFSYAPGTETTFTLPAPVSQPVTSRTVFVGFTATGNTVASGQLQVSAGASSVTVSLAAASVPPVPVDLVLVIDRSGSMSDPTSVAGQRKIDYAIEAGELLVALLRENDRLGVVRYNQASGPADVLLNPRTMGAVGTGAGRAAARSALDVANLTPTGATSIGAGIINGSGVLSTAGTSPARALVVLTDGLQNTAPDVPTAQTTVATTTPRQRVFAVGLGLNQLEDTLEQIASTTNGFAQITGELVDQREFLLQKLYVQILTDLLEEAFVRDPVDVLHPGQSRATPVAIGDVDVACDFIVVWRPSPAFPKLLRFRLEAPDGTVIDPTVPSPAIQFVLEDRHAFIRVGFPLDPAAPSAHVGTWKVLVGAVQAPNAALEDLRYSVLAKTRSNLLLRGRVIQGSTLPGSPIAVELEASLSGQPQGLDEPVDVEVTRPDGAVRTIQLTAQTPGLYRGTFTETGLIGPYGFDAEVGITTPAGARVTRYRHMTGLIFRPKPPVSGGGTGGGGPGGPIGPPGGGGPGGGGVVVIVGGT